MFDIGRKIRESVGAAVGSDSRRQEVQGRG